jgi:transposase
MSRTKPWEVSDELWEKVKPLIPPPERDANREYKRKPGGGRKPADARKVFEGIVRVLRTGCQWNSLTLKRDGVGSSSVHSYFLKWTKAGVFLELWNKGLAEYDELEGIAWEWQSVDASQVKAPLAQEAVGANPTDRGKKWKQGYRSGRRAWSPALALHNRREHPRGDANREDSAFENPFSGRQRPRN